MDIDPSYIYLAVWFVIALVVFKRACKGGFFNKYSFHPLPEIRAIDLLRGFGGYIFMAAIFVPFVFVRFVLHNKNGKISTLSNIEILTMHACIVAGCFLACLCAYLCLTTEMRRRLWNTTEVSSWHNFRLGMVSWFLIYPVMMIASQLLAHIVNYIFPHPWIEQDMLQNLRQAMSYKMLFTIMVFLTVTLVPLTEEFLFRGLLQSWFRRRMGRFLAIGTTSIVFALVHYSPVMGYANIELMGAIFLLSCVLGYLYERQRSLWASLGLHSFFNFMTIIFIVFQ